MHTKSNTAWICQRDGGSVSATPGRRECDLSRSRRGAGYVWSLVRFHRVVVSSLARHHRAALRVDAAGRRLVLVFRVRARLFSTKQILLLLLLARVNDTTVFFLRLHSCRIIADQHGQHEQRQLHANRRNPHLQRSQWMQSKVTSVLVPIWPFI